MIYTIPHVIRFGESWSKLRIQWETVHLSPLPRASRGIGFVYLDIDWLEYIRAMNTPEAFQWMCGDSGTIIWGIKDKKDIGSRKNKARMPVIAIGGNRISLDETTKGWGRVFGMDSIHYALKPDTHPAFWHRIYCVTKLAHGQISGPHDTPRGPAFMPILDVGGFKRSKSLAAGVTYCKVL